MTTTCNELFTAQCLDLSFNNETLDELLTCLTFLCNVTVEDQKRTSFLGYLATNNSAYRNDSNYRNYKTVEAYLLGIATGYAVPVNGYLSPVIILLTIITNTLVCIVLLKPHMRTPVNFILVFIALSDTMSGVFSFPVYIYFYATERVHEWIPYNWCYAIEVLEYHIPIIFHTASIWLTTALTIQRYICVCHPFKARNWCTMRNVIYGISAIYLLATLIHIPLFIEIYITETRVRSRINPNVLVSACIRRWRPWFATNYRLYMIIYHGFRVIVISLIPCVSLIVLNTLLIYTMRKAMRRRIQLLRQNMKRESQHLKENNSTTMMLVTVVALALLVEVPIAVIMTLWILEQMLEITFFALEIQELLILFANFFVLLSYPINFVIYCGMSKRFRDTFKRLFTGNRMT